MAAERCPVCYGSGHLSVVVGDEQYRQVVAVGDLTKVCHGCFGRGWVNTGCNHGRCSCCWPPAEKRELFLPLALFERFLDDTPGP